MNNIEIDKKDFISRGKDGEVYICYLKTKSGKTEYTKKFAVKVFKNRKSSEKFKQEVAFLREASLNDISPKIIYPTKDNIRKNKFDKIIVMELLGDNLMKYLEKENGNLSVSQQKKIINLFKTLDKLGILHGDPNPLNFLLDKNGDFLIIDYGFAREINENEIKKINKNGMNVTEKNANVRLMCLGLLMQLSPYMNVKTLKEFIKHVEPSKRYIFQ